MRRLRHLSWSLPLVLLTACGGTGSGPSFGGDPTEPGMPGSWIPIPHLGTDLSACQAYNFETSDSNARIRPFTSADLVGYSVIDHGSGDRYATRESSTWVPAGVSLEDLGFTCNYRALPEQYSNVIEHFESNALVGEVHEQFVWEGGETVSNVHAGWSLDVSASHPDSNVSWAILRPRFGVSIARCYDDRYPEQFEPGTGDRLGNNVVCISINDGGSRTIRSYLDPESGASGDSGNTSESAALMACIQAAMSGSALQDAHAECGQQLAED